MTRKVAVTAVKKSQATIAWARFFRKVDQRWSRDLRGPGGCLLYSATVRGEEPNPELQQQFIGNAFFSPGWILSRAMPADQSGWLNDHQCATPVDPARQLRKHKPVGRGGRQGFLLAFPE